MGITRPSFQEKGQRRNVVNMRTGTSTVEDIERISRSLFDCLCDLQSQTASLERHINVMRGRIDNCQEQIRTIRNHLSDYTAAESEAMIAELNQIQTSLNEERREIQQEVLSIRERYNETARSIAEMLLQLNAMRQGLRE
ncbi:hypothetical protein O9G_002990 [Rozella allomycis CSF55]|uniref:Uncharacterized protein n=1 Tax=Rozella allomycis (strain CSF55) TaxID=988480 RepID=A0A075AVU5_ROZAC|nr:hypothetical protein O9G_002990 [Rozella allomycis CSF55]|eukprot:EPZ34270.1 hypothetical protein O9G_002990 [Rozella allomycis CSF55]